MEFPSAWIWRSNRSFEENEELSLDKLSSRMPIRDQSRAVKYRIECKRLDAKDRSGQKVHMWSKQHIKAMRLDEIT